LTLLNGKALGQADQYKPNQTETKPSTETVEAHGLILTSSASKILQKFMTPPMAVTITTTATRRKGGPKVGGGAQNCQ